MTVGCKATTWLVVKPARLHFARTARALRDATCVIYCVSEASCPNFEPRAHARLTGLTTRLGEHTRGKNAERTAQVRQRLATTAKRYCGSSAGSPPICCLTLRSNCAHVMVRFSPRARSARRLASPLAACASRAQKRGP